MTVPDASSERQFLHLIGRSGDHPPEETREGIPAR
jgi:hypothetical protein